jgi:hypothetical protein
MKYAYISTQEPFSLGVRIVQIENTKEGLVDVDGVLFWVECPDYVTTTDFYYDMMDKQFKKVDIILQPTSEVGM